jgi:Glycosyl hydrolase catalytic core
MRLRIIVPLALLMALAVSAPASAAYRVGLSEQSAGVFADGAWQQLKLKRMRYIVPWDVLKHADQAAVADQYLQAARANRQDILLTFTAAQGCFVNGKYSKKRACRPPSSRAYKQQFLAFKRKYPFIKSYSVWNEINHVSQPTSKSPKRAAGYYNAIRNSCRGCKIMAADVLDQTNMVSYLRQFLRHAKGKPRLWGLHNYKDVNRNRSTGLRGILRTVPGEVWLTETGGIVKLQPQFKFSTSRASKATRFLFKLADRYDTRRAGNRSKMTRIYYYRWFGEPANSRFDAGLTDVSGKPRPAFKTFSRVAKRHR